MPRASGMRGRAYSAEESEALVAAVRPLYAKLYGSQEEQVGVSCTHPSLSLNACVHGVHC